LVFFRTLALYLDLSRPFTLRNIKSLFQQAQSLNRAAHSFLVGTKYDLFTEMSAKEQDDVDSLAKKYAGIMGATLVYTSSSHSINVQSTFQLVVSKVFCVQCAVTRITRPGEPLILY
jgi:GTPase SAR1 family protein